MKGMKGEPMSPRMTMPASTTAIGFQNSLPKSPELRRSALNRSARSTSLKGLNAVVFPISPPRTTRYVDRTKKTQEAGGVLAAMRMRFFLWFGNETTRRDVLC